MSTIDSLDFCELATTDLDAVTGGFGYTSKKYKYVDNRNFGVQNSNITGDNSSQTVNFVNDGSPGSVINVG